MDMTVRLSTNSDSYIGARKWWSSYSIDVVKPVYSDISLGNWQVMIVKPFRDWLATQGCRIVEHGDSECAVDSYNVAVGIDELEFETEMDRTAFLLRWS